MRNDVGVTDIDGAIRQNGAKKRADDAFRLVGASDVTVADVENNQRVNFRRYIRRRR